MKSTVYLLGNVNYLTKNKSTILFFLIKALSFNERVILLFLNYLTTLPSEPVRLRHFKLFIISEKYEKRARTNLALFCALLASTTTS